MKNKEKDFNTLQLETQEAVYLMQSGEWRVFINFIKERQKNFQYRANEAVKKGDIVEAKVQLALLEDSIRQVEVFANQTKQNQAKLNKEKSNG